MARPLGLIAVAVLGTGLGSLEAQVGTYLTWDESVASAFPEAVEVTPGHTVYCWEVQLARLSRSQSGQRGFS